ncbi:hypothetical protein MVES1_001464 [Malassezia vespertilionis]|uniref:Methyltransferase type 11 domain-containing protein n=1 Tax=Malassezia vespertilionis TaxID=2020962 RepID=A0A2N1JEL0_9BASI|nr:uncharacterized protein MVES1_001464 [Malassezia vespertilionis]PKI84990.1 hypothetical protein MVES_001381 [Malassezia vespertilionis]WFD06123.1 hypothetical protein MVES1_001464 [Malassezia vespertilionis]
MSSSTRLLQATPTSTPTPYRIFDRGAKEIQRSRAAIRRPVDNSGTAFEDESKRGTLSRQTDYIREFCAQSLSERLLDVDRKFPTVVELGAGAGHLRKHLDVRGTGVEKLIMCDTSEALLNRDKDKDGEYPFEIERRIVDEELLPFESNSLDCVVASGSLHWTNDLPGALIQIQRALKPDGVFIGYMLGGDTLFELRTSLMVAELERQGGLSVHVSPMTDTRDVSSLLSRANFTLQTVDLDEITVYYPGMIEIMQDLQNMGESNAVSNRNTFLHRDTLIAAAATYQALHGTEEGHLPATFAPIFMIGWKPSPEQRKPLERGAASHSLKDVL